LSSRHLLPAGTVLDGAYRIERVLGAGGFGVTYEVEDLHLGARVALKEYYPSDFGDRDASLSVRPKSERHRQTFEWGRTSFLQEARTLARFRHPSIVRISRVFEANSTAYMVMDFEQGQSFEAWLAGLGRAPTQAELDRIAGPLLDALELMHTKSLLHRDIAPDNIIVRDDGTPVLLDFGAARQAISERSRSLTGIVKAGYSPQEQYATDSRLQGPWSDLYALAGTLYRAISGRPPEESTLRVSDDRLRPAVEAAKGKFRPGFLAAIDACLRVKPGDRPQSVAQLRPMLVGEAPAQETRRLAAETQKIEAELPASQSTGMRLIAKWWPAAVGALILVAGVFGGLQYARRLADDRARIETEAKRRTVPPMQTADSKGDEAIERWADDLKRKVEEEEKKPPVEEISPEQKAAQAQRDFVEGERYYYGRGVPQSHAKAREFYEKAAAAGHGLGLATLGWLYTKGIGVAQDYARAREWLEKAAAAGDGHGLNQLGALYEGGFGVPQDYAKARELYARAVEAGNSSGMVNLGWIYHTGLGVPEDLVKAREWYEKALAAGNVAGARNFAFLLDGPRGGPADMPRAAKLLLMGAKANDHSALEVLRSDMLKWSRRCKTELKRELARLGFFKGPIDDKWDDKARAAVEELVAANQ
jgi:TPR repeat protein